MQRTGWKFSALTAFKAQTVCVLTAIKYRYFACILFQTTTYTNKSVKTLWLHCTISFANNYKQRWGIRTQIRIPHRMQRWFFRIVIRIWIHYFSKSRIRIWIRERKIIRICIRINRKNVRIRISAQKENIWKDSLKCLNVDLLTQHWMFNSSLRTVPLQVGTRLLFTAGHTLWWPQLEPSLWPVAPILEGVSALRVQL